MALRKTPVRTCASHSSAKNLPDVWVHICSAANHTQTERINVNHGVPSPAKHSSNNLMYLYHSKSMINDPREKCAFGAKARISKTIGD
jgi:hypothetical protein